MIACILLLRPWPVATAAPGSDFGTNREVRVKLHQYWAAQVGDFWPVVMAYSTGFQLGSASVGQQLEPFQTRNVNACARFLSVFSLFSTLRRSRLRLHNSRVGVPPVDILLQSTTLVPYPVVRQNGRAFHPPLSWTSSILPTGKSTR